MSKVTQFVARSSAPTPTSIGSVDASVGKLLQRGPWLGVPPRLVVTGAGLVMIGLLGWANFQAKRGLTFDYFYLLVFAVVGWLSGSRSALGGSTVSLITV